MTPFNLPGSGMQVYVVCAVLQLSPECVAPAVVFRVAPALVSRVCGSCLQSVQLTVVCCAGLQLSPECVAAAEDVDLVVLEGMGRAIETNLYASFSCDSLKLAMVKHPEV